MSKQVLTTKTPMVVLSNSLMILPGTTAYIIPRNASTTKLFEEVRDNKYTTLIAILGDEVNGSDKFFKVGVACEANAQTVGNEDRLYLKGLFRIKSLNWTKMEKWEYWVTDWILFEDEPDDFYEDQKEEHILRSEYRITMRSIRKEIRMLLAETVNELRGMRDSNIQDFESILSDMDSYNFYSKESLDYFVWSTLTAMSDIEVQDKYDIMSSRSLTKRLYLLMNCLSAIIEVARGVRVIDKNLRGKINAGDDGREAKKDPGTSIQINEKRSDELPDDEKFSTNDEDLAEKYKKYLKMKKSIKDVTEKNIFREAAMKDFKRLMAFERAGSERTEVAMFNTHLDFILSLPWGKESPRKEDFKEFETIFESEHFGLKKVKDEISDHVAVRKKRPDGKGGVLCFIGPPGVGKTSVCKSIARGQGLEYIRISLGGIRDEAEIRGHRRTYIGALPGRIMTGIKTAGTKNPVFVLDEIDKLGNDLRGSPADALLEVLDSEQNHSFSDHYLEAPFDLSKVFFVCTANTVSGIPVALRDRMDKIYFSGYTEEEKVQIAKNFLVPKVFTDVGLIQEGFDVKWHNNNPDEILLKIIVGYTKEAGVRDIERKLLKIARKIVKEDMKDPGYASRVIITEELVEKIHGRPEDRGRAKETEFGEAIGLVIDEVGRGDITYVQARLSIKTGFMDKSISQTDEAGDALHKSTQRAITVAKSKIENCPEIIKRLKTHLINVQVSDSFTPTDGPSAGITVAVATHSELTHQLVKPYVAMTGAISLTGRVRSVGGVREKVIAAANAGVKEVILPESNRKDFDEEVPQSAKLKLEKTHFVENIDQVLAIVFPKNNPA